MANYILVHGSWHGAWCWENIIPLLESQGHRVYAPDLPGHGREQTPIKDITLNHYVDCVSRVVTDIEGPVILVGHSLGGIIISQVAEQMPERIKKLIYIAAFVPQNGESMFMVAAKQPPTRFFKCMRQDPAENAFHFDLAHVKDFAYHQCSDEVFATILPRLCVEPLLPSTTPVSLTQERFGSIPRTYIECTEDQAILLSTQRNIHAQVPCHIETMACDHSPFYSDPAGLAKLLLQS